jgi:putative salt-induced outer membrane protein
MKKKSKALALAALAYCGNVSAEDVQADGRWRGNGGAALSISSGNTQSRSLNLNMVAARVTDHDKLSLYGQILSSRATANGVTSTSANQWKAGTRYDRNISPNVFGFGGLDFNHDQIQQLSLRSVISGGLGYHLIKTPENRWDIFGGLDYRADRYSGLGILVDNSMQTRFNTVELLLGEESNHKLTETTTFRQHLVVYPNLSNGGGYRATLDSGLAVSLSKAMNLNITLQDRYDSRAQAPIRKNDLMFFTGVSIKFGG